MRLYPVFLQELQRGDWPNWTPGDVDVYLPILDDAAFGKVKDLVCEWMTWHQGADSYIHNEVFESQDYGGSSPSMLPEDTVALETPMDWMAPPDVEGHSYTGAKVGEMLDFQGELHEGAPAASFVRQLAGVFQAHATRHFGIPKPYKLHRVVKIDPGGLHVCSNTLNAYRIKCIGVNLIMYRSERCLTPAEVTAGFDLAVAQSVLTCAAGSEQLTAWQSDHAAEDEGLPAHAHAPLFARLHWPRGQNRRAHPLARRNRGALYQVCGAGVCAPRRCV